MDKIKNNVPSLGEKIRAIVFENPLATTRLRLRIAENIFILAAFVYFFATLMAVGGLLPDIASMVVFFAYPILTLSILALVYMLMSYTLLIHAESLLFLRYPILIGCVIVYAGALVHHLGIYSSLISLAWLK